MMLMKHLQKPSAMEKKYGADLIHIETMSDTYEVKGSHSCSKRKFFSSGICNHDL